MLALLATLPCRGTELQRSDKARTPRRPGCARAERCRAAGWKICSSCCCWCARAFSRAAQIVLRNVFSVGLVWADGFVRLLVLWIAVVGAIAASRDHKHIAIDALARVAPPWMRRAGGVSSLFTSGVAGLLAYHCWALRRRLARVRRHLARHAGRPGSFSRAARRVCADRLSLSAARARVASGVGASVVVAGLWCSCSRCSARRCSRSLPRARCGASTRGHRSVGHGDRVFRDRGDARAGGDSAVHVRGFPAQRGPRAAAARALSQALLGWMPGGLAIVSLAACALFTAFTGASGVTIIALGALFCAGAVAGGLRGTLQPRARHGLRQPGAAVRAVVAADSLRHRRRRRRSTIFSLPASCRACSC